MDKKQPKFRSKFCGNCRGYDGCLQDGRIPKSKTLRALRERSLHCSWYTKKLCYGHHDDERFHAPTDSQTCLHCEALSLCIDQTIAREAEEKGHKQGELTAQEENEAFYRRSR